MSIFGQAYPKFIVNILSGREEILLPHAMVLKDEPDYRNFSSRAVRTGKKKFVHEGFHWTFQVRVSLWKYSDPAATYTLLKNYEGTKVNLYRRSDGELFCNADNVPAEFILLTVNEKYTDEKNKFDYLILSFYSCELTNPVPEFPLDVDAAYYMDSVEDGGTTDGNFWKDKAALGTVNELTKSFERGSSNFYLDLNGHEARRIYVFNAFPGTDFAFGSTTTETQPLRTGQDFTVIMTFCRHTYPALSDAGRRGLFELLTSGGNYFRIYNAEHLVVTMGDGTHELIVTSSGAYADVGGGDSEFYTIAVVFDQTNKTIRMYTNTGEFLTDTDVAYDAVDLSTAVSGYPKIGVVTGITGAYAGAVGDIIFFTNALTQNQLNYYATLQAIRAGLDWTV